MLIWHLVGEKAGEFEDLPEKQAKQLVKRGAAQVCDGSELRYAENHPYVKSGKIPAPEITPEARGKKKYPNKMMTTEDADGSSE